MFYFCHLKKLVRPETFGPYYVCWYFTVIIYTTGRIISEEISPKLQYPYTKLQ